MDILMNYRGTLCEDCKQCGLCLEMEDYILGDEFDGDIFVISDGKFIKTLSADEFRVYYSFIGIISKNNGKGQHYIYKNDLNFSDLAQELRLKGRTEGTIMARQTLKAVFDSLVKKKIFKLSTLDNGSEVYYIMTTQNYMFTRMPKETYNAFSKTLSGDALKIFCYIKGNLDNVKSKGGSILYLTRTRIATDCGITNKGKIGERQLKTVGTILKTLGSFGVIDYTMTKKVIDGKIKSRYEIYDVNTDIKKEKEKEK